jgi:energy-coupling factor transport system permease protein
MTRVGLQGRARSLHPMAWWLWALALAICAMRTTNPFLLLLTGAVACFVVANCRGNAPWSRSLAFFLRLGVLVIVIRVVIEILFGQRGLAGQVLFTMPRLPLPSWMRGVSVGGAVTAEAIVQSAVEGLQFAVIVLCFGAANSLASPYRLLRCLPAVLYETGVALTVSLSFTPELVQTIALVHQARRMRGIPTKGMRALRGIAVPVLEGALDRSLQLATSMDARGYGRRSPMTGMSRRLATGATVGGLLLAAVGLYGIIDSGSLFGLGLPIFGLSILLCGVGLAVGGRRSARTRYRPDPWQVPEWLVGGSGVVALIALVMTNALGITGLSPSFSNLTVPTLPLLPVLGIAVALVPVLIAATPVSARPRAADPVSADSGTAPVRDRHKVPA